MLIVLPHGAAPTAGTWLATRYGMATFAAPLRVFAQTSE
jgi:hypothetical protein